MKFLEWCGGGGDGGEREGSSETESRTEEKQTYRLGMPTIYANFPMSL